MTTTSLSRAILHVVHYADLFDAPVTAEEVHRYLPQAASLFVVRHELLQLVTRGTLVQDSSLYYLPGRDNLVAQRHMRYQASMLQWQRGARLVRMLSHISWIEMVGITGALSVNSSTVDDDIDLFIVTAPRRLWLTRLIVVLLFRARGVYRHRACPNMWVTRDALAFAGPDYYLARELLQLVPVYTRDGCYEDLLAKNGWYTEFLPNVRPFVPRTSFPSSRRVFRWLGDVGESIAYRAQYLYMRSRITSETVDRNRAFFLRRDVRPTIRASLEQRLRTFTIMGQ